MQAAIAEIRPRYRRMPYSGSGQSSPSTRRSNAAYQPTVEDSPPVARREMGLFDNPKMFTAFVWLANIGLAASVTYLGACTSTLEKRFQLKSSQTAFFFTVTDIVGLFTVLFVIYYGQKRNRARVLGALYLICACGSFVCSIPHYLYSLPAALDPATQSNYTGEVKINFIWLIWIIYHVYFCKSFNRKYIVCSMPICQLFVWSISRSVESFTYSPLHYNFINIDQGQMANMPHTLKSKEWRFTLWECSQWTLPKSEHWSISVIYSFALQSEF